MGALWIETMAWRVSGFRNSSRSARWVLCGLKHHDAALGRRQELVGVPTEGSVD